MRPHAPPSSRSAHAHEGGALLRGATVERVQAHALGLARQVVGRAQTCLYVSARDPQALAVHAADAGFDLAQASRDGRFRLLPLPEAFLRPHDASDDDRTQALADLTTVARRRRPDYLIVEDAVPLAVFDDDDWFDAAFAAMHDRLAESGTAFILMMAGVEGSRIYDRLAAHVAHRHALSPLPPPVAQGDGTDQHFEPSVRLAVPPPSAQATEYVDFRSFKGTPERKAPDPGSQNLNIGRGHYVAADATLPDPTHTAAHLSPLDRALLGGTTVEAHSDGDNGAEPVTLDAGLFEAVDVEQTLAAFESPVPSTACAASTATPDPRLAFVRGFNDALAEHEAHGTPFIALALRMPDDHPAGRRFHFVISAIRRCVGPEALVLADEPRRRVAVLLPDGDSGAVQSLLTAIREDLRASTAEAAYVMESAAAVVVPDGAPFPNATEFLAHVYD